MHVAEGVPREVIMNLKINYYLTVVMDTISVKSMCPIYTKEESNFTSFHIPVTYKALPNRIIRLNNTFIRNDLNLK